MAIEDVRSKMDKWYVCEGEGKGLIYPHRCGIYPGDWSLSWSQPNLQKTLPVLRELMLLDLRTFIHTGLKQESAPGSQVILWGKSSCPWVRWKWCPRRHVILQWMAGSLTLWIDVSRWIGERGAIHLLSLEGKEALPSQASPSCSDTWLRASLHGHACELAGSTPCSALCWAPMDYLASPPHTLVCFFFY